MLGATPADAWGRGHRYGRPRQTRTVRILATGNLKCPHYPRRILVDLACGMPSRSDGPPRAAVHDREASRRVLAGGWVPFHSRLAAAAQGRARPARGLAPNAQRRLPGHPLPARRLGQAGSAGAGAGVHHVSEHLACICPDWTHGQGESGLVARSGRPHGRVPGCAQPGPQVGTPELQEPAQVSTMSPNTCPRCVRSGHMGRVPRGFGGEGRGAARAGPRLRAAWATSVYRGRGDAPRRTVSGAVGARTLTPGRGGSGTRSLRTCAEVGE